MATMQSDAFADFPFSPSSLSCKAQVGTPVVDDGGSSDDEEWKEMRALFEPKQAQSTSQNDGDCQCRAGFSGGGDGNVYVCGCCRPC